MVMPPDSESLKRKRKVPLACWLRHSCALALLMNPMMNLDTNRQTSTDQFNSFYPVDEYTRPQAIAPRDRGRVYSSTGNRASGPWTSILVHRQSRLGTVDEYTRPQAIAPRDRGRVYSSTGNRASGPWTSILVHRQSRLGTVDEYTRPAPLSAFRCFSFGSKSCLVRFIHTSVSVDD